MAASEKHLANRLRHSLRAYLSILYMRLPETFCILLHGRVVQYHNVATDLKYPEFILYKPLIGGCAKEQVITTVGFLKEAPDVHVHGFNIYHKNRLILPFWPVVNFSHNKGRGVVGVLEANFIEPTHSKQDFEKTSGFQKLENRLKEMTDYHCGLIGYTFKPKSRASLPSKDSANFTHHHGNIQPVGLLTSAASASGVSSVLHELSSIILSSRLRESSSVCRNPEEGFRLKRKECNQSIEPEVLKRNSSLGANTDDIDSNLATQPGIDEMELDQEAINVIQENKRLRERCLVNEKTEKELDAKVVRLRTELVEAHTRLV